jgi:hypothetical protein
MFKRRFLRIFIVSALISVAIPLCQRFLWTPPQDGQGLDLLTAVCLWSTAPGYWIAVAVLPFEYMTMSSPPNAELVVWPVFIAGNILSWTLALALVLFAIDLVRHRWRTKTSNEAT